MAKKHKNIQIIHQTGCNDKTDWQALYKKYALSASFSVYERMHELYAATDIIICRSGAGSLFEAVHYNKLCITIPLEAHADNHRVKNALAIARQHANIVQVLFQNILEKDIVHLQKLLIQQLFKLIKFNLKNKILQSLLNYPFVLKSSTKIHFQHSKKRAFSCFLRIFYTIFR